MKTFKREPVNKEQYAVLQGLLLMNFLNSISLFKKMGKSTIAEIYMHKRASLSNSVTGVNVYERQFRENLFSWELKLE